MQCYLRFAPRVLHYTVEPPNKGQVGAWALVHYSGVVLYWGVFVKKPFLCVVSIELYILTNYDGQSWSSSSYNVSMVTDIDLRTLCFHTGRSNEVSQ